MIKISSLLSMKIIYTFAIVLILTSCGDNGSQPTTNPAAIDSTAKVSVADYLFTRDRTIDYIKQHSSAGVDFIQKMESDSTAKLEKLLRLLFTGSRLTELTTQGKINLETFEDGVGFGMADGLTLSQGERNIFCTSKKLFTSYFGKDTLERLKQLDPALLESIFQATFYADAAVTNFASTPLDASAQIVAYGMVACVAQDIGPLLPRTLLVLLADENYIYIIEEPLTTDFTEIKNCKAVWDSLSLAADVPFKRYQQSALKDTAAFNDYLALQDKGWKDYCNCYRQQLPQQAKFKNIKQQMQSMLNALK